MFKYTQNDTVIGLGNALESILNARGVTDTTTFLNLTESVIENYNDYDNMSVGVYMLKKHILNGSRICLVVDSDLDGYSSGAEMYMYLRDLYEYFKLPFTLEYTIHSGKAHGLTPENISKIKSGNYNLVIIPDASSEEHEQHLVLKNMGLDIIVLDHHPTDRGYSPGALVINNQLSNKIKNKAMTGVGVVYKFNQALDKEFNVNFADKYLDLVALGMIGDSSDLRDFESRFIVLKGLELIEDGINKNKFISTIYKNKAFSMKNKATILGVAFYMCPFVNCIIRGGDYETKHLLFKAFIGSDERFEDKVRGKGIVEMGIEDYMVRLYGKLKKLQDKIKIEGLNSLSEQIEQYGLNKSEIMVVNGSELPNKEYNRLIVNQVCEKYQKHCLLLQPFGNELRGSASGRKNKDITDLKQWCKDTKLFTLVGGHPMAFGVGIKRDNINNLYQLISTIPSNDTLNYLVDGIFTEKTLNKTVVSSIGKMENMWGNKLDEPIFAVENIILDTQNDIELMGKTKTTLKIICNGIPFIKFKFNEDLYNDMLKFKSIKFTAICKFKVNEYNNTVEPQIMIEDMFYVESKEVKVFKF